MALFVLGSFADDPQGILAAIYWLALVGVKLCQNIAPLERGVAPFADGNGWRSLLYKPELAFSHTQSLAHLEEKP
jgi:hypothetical protein